MKRLYTTLITLLAFTSMVSESFATDLARYKFFYEEGLKRFYKGEYKQAYNNFRAASICEDAQPPAKVMMKTCTYCQCHYDTAEYYYDEAKYLLALDHYSIVAQNNSRDMNCRSKMTLCIKKGNDFKKDMVFVKGGNFSMGRNDGPFNESPAHNVLVDDFYMDKTEVSNSQFVNFLNISGIYSNEGILRINLENPECKILESGGWYYVENGFENYPVVAVSWYGASDYAKWADKSLPTEAQWEYAFADSKDKTEKKSLHAVNIGQANKFELLNMNGNVWEWCQDWYAETSYQLIGQINPVTTDADAEYKTMRGGAYTSESGISIKTFRDYNLPYECKKNVGFRCVKNCPNYRPNNATY